MSIWDGPSSRRWFLTRSSLLSAFAGGRLWGRALPEKVKAGEHAGVYERLGVRTRINAKGVYTYLSGSLLPPEVAQAMEEASRHFVFLEELQRAAGERIARLLGVEAACVTSGAAGAIVLGTAACVAGKDSEKIARLPDVNGMKNEVIVQKAHRNPFHHAIRNVGVRLVEIDTEEELERAITPKTAMMFFLNKAQNDGRIGREKWIEVARRHDIPTFNDAAADIPPASRLSEYNRLGFDLVAFSGGKALRGPQCSGLLLGRKDLIEAALLNNNPNEDSIGRPMKVGKEEIVGLWAALERYLEIDHEAEWKNWERQLETIEKAVSTIPGVRTSRFVPDIDNHVPHLLLQWDEKVKGFTIGQLAQNLRDGNPSIECLPDEYPQGFSLTPYMLKPGEEVIVGRRLREVLNDGK
jgi:uncharacterized pyridoxal phosphate-dependent enzyme